VTPTYQTTGRFDRDLETLDARQRQRFRDKVEYEFVPALRSGHVPPGLRGRGLEGVSGVYEPR
jgi:hypothetical protein